MQLENLSALYAFFDNLVDEDVDADILFASSYLRGFISLAASNFGDEQQLLSQPLYDDITNRLYESRSELTPNDRKIVNDYWADLKVNFVN